MIPRHSIKYNGFRLSLFFVLYSCFSFAQNYTISGLVKEKNTGEFAIGATVYIKELKKSASVNNYGFYSLTVPKGCFSVICMFVGTEIFSQTLELDKNI